MTIHDPKHMGRHGGCVTSRIGHGEVRGKVKLGIAGQAEIVNAQESILSLLVKKIRQSISLG
jgi:hypothetical protein